MGWISLYIFPVLNQSAQPPAVLNLPQPPLTDSIVKVRTIFGHGTGVIVEQDSEYLTIMTAGHCLQTTLGEPVFTVIADNGFEGSVEPGSVYCDPSVDIGLCRVPKSDQTFVTVPWATVPGQVGDAVQVCGYGLFRNKWTAQCFVGADPAKGSIWLDGHIHMGQSGSPILNSRDHIVGIIIAKMNPRIQDGIGQGVSLRMCRNALARYKILKGLD